MKDAIFALIGGALAVLVPLAAYAETLQGSWSSCNGATVIVNGNSYAHYINGQPYDAGVLYATSNGTLTTNSQHGRGSMTYGFEFRHGKLILMESPQSVFEFWRTYQNPARNRCECVAFEDYALCLDQASRG